jgi:hypothetical protein
MAGLDPAIHVFFVALKTWMPGTRPGMTKSNQPGDVGYFVKSILNMFGSTFFVVSRL